MIDQDLIQTILQQLGTLSEERKLPVGSERFENLGDKRAILEHLLYIKNKGLITGQEIRTGADGITLNRIKQIQLTHVGQDAILELKGKRMTVNTSTAADTGIDIFISHSSRDKEIAARLIELLRNALNIPADRIRCTSVDGYRLRVGADTNAQLRQEVHDAKVFIGLITQASVESAYVLFELGARWGAGRFLAPLLALWEDVQLLHGPIAGLNALSCDSREQMFQLIEDIGGELNIPVRNQASYSQYIDVLVRECQTRREATTNQNQPQPAQHTAEDYDESDIIGMLEEYIRVKSGGNLAPFVIRYADADRELGFKEGTTRDHIEAAAESGGYGMKNKGANSITLWQEITIL